MNNKGKLILIGSLFILLMSGCNALKLKEANQALSNHYFAREQAVKDNNPLLEGSINLSLQDLANETKSRAKEDDNVLNKIAFYRIAATAAWQSRQLKASDYANDGQKLCEDDANVKQMPVHCGMLIFIPVFSAADGHSIRANTIQSEIKQAKRDNNTTKLDQLKSEAAGIFNGYRTAISVSIAAKKRISNYRLSDGFKKTLDDNLDRLACQHLGQANAIFQQAGGASVKNECPIYQTQVALNKILTLSCPEKFETAPSANCS